MQLSFVHYSSSILSILDKSDDDVTLARSRALEKKTGHKKSREIFADSSQFKIPRDVNAFIPRLANDTTIIFHRKSKENAKKRDIASQLKIKREKKIVFT